MRLTRVWLQRSIGFIYFIAFFSSAQQFKSLIGEHGLLPAHLFIKKIHFWQAPSLFFLNTSDLFIGGVIWMGVFLSLLTLSGYSERFGVWVSAGIWTLLWIFYSSIVNIGQTFYGFGWEIMLLEVGFLAIFLGSEDTEPSRLLVWFYRWVLFRLMFGAGLIKLRGDECWRDFTCMEYHYETQPMPNPLSWYFHHLPTWLLKFQTLYTHFIELVVPFFYFFAGPLGWIAGILTIIFQVCLILSGNLSWLNYLTIAVTFSCFDDRFLKKIVPMNFSEMKKTGLFRKIILGSVASLILILSIPPALNLFSQRQLMNASFEPFHLVNTYGAFGSVTKNRTEIIFEGTMDTVITPLTKWKEYEFKGKPGNVRKTPPIVAPYHMRLDWLLWFAAMSDWHYYPWLLNFANKLLSNDTEMLKQIAYNPFPNHVPHYIRAVLYNYRFTTPEEKKKTGNIWVRSPARLYLPPLSLDNEGFKRLLKRTGWDQ